jgi:hypothetical protein
MAIVAPIAGPSNPNLAILNAGVIACLMPTEEHGFSLRIPGSRRIISFFPGIRAQSEAPVVSLDSQRQYLSEKLPIGVTASVPLNKHQSLKFSYSNGDYVLCGGNYQSRLPANMTGWGDPNRRGNRGSSCFVGFPDILLLIL